MRDLVGRYGTAIAGLLLIAFFLAFARNFANPTNLLNIVKDTSFLAILALGFALALRIAELDLSIAEVSSLAAVTAGWMIQSKADPALAVAAALAVGAASA
jgi:ribose transport system permease protein